MQQILQHLLQAHAAATIASLNAEAAYDHAVASRLPPADLARLAPGRHRLLLRDLNQAIDRASSIASADAPQSGARTSPSRFLTPTPAPAPVP